MTSRRKKIKYWDYPFKEKIDKKNQLDLDQGNTPVTKLTNKQIPSIPIGTTIYLKREEKNPNGSFKDRALAYQISYLKQHNIDTCVISSSGNAAISTAAFCNQAQIKAIILISPDIPENKLSQIVKHKPYLIIKSKKAARLTNYISKKYKIPNLRPSKDNNAIAGFETLGWEIHQQNPDTDAIVSYITSGTSLLGIHQYYAQNQKNTIPQLIASSSGEQTILPKLFDQKPNKEKNIAGQNALLKPIRYNQIVKAIKQTDGKAVWTSNKNIQKYQKLLLHKLNINSSPEGAAALATAIKLARNNSQIKKITCIISGEKHEPANLIIPFIPTANNKDDIDQIVEIKKIIDQINPKDIFVTSTSPTSAIGLESIMASNIICFDDHPIVKLLKEENTNIFSLEKENRNTPKRRSTSVLIKNTKLHSWVKKISQNPSIVVFKPSTSIEKICQKNGWNILTNPTPINRKFENKITFTKICKKLKLPQPQHDTKKLLDINYQKYHRLFGKEFFIQFPRGFAGTSTFLIKNQSELNDLQQKYPNRPCKISKKIIGPTYTLNGCVTTNNNIIIQRPFYQITNIPELNSSPGGTCGNIYSDNLEIIDDLSKLIDDAKKFGKELKKDKYLGIFGLDFVIDTKTGQHYFIECNPRLTASIPMITKLQIENNEMPLLLIHILEFLKINYQLGPKSIKKIETNPRIGAQIIFRNVKDRPSKPPLYYKNGIYSIKKLKDIYQLKKLVLKKSPQIKYLRPGKDILDIKKENEFLILCEPNNKIISPEIEYLRIQIRN